MPSFSTPSPRHDRIEIASLLNEHEVALASGQSERAFCRDAGIPRSTLRDAAEREALIDVSDATAAFFGSPEGHLLLRRLVVAAHLTITLQGCGGIAVVSMLLRLAGLEPFVACSFGAQHRVHTRLVERLGAFGQAETQRLGATMPAKKLWLCEDETYFPRMVLVALDALSGFLLVEQFADKRNAETWSQVVEKALGNLPVEVLGVTSDQAQGIRSHAQKNLGLAITPDLFHVQHEVSGVCCAPLASRVRELQKKLEETEAQGDETERIVQSLREAQERQERMKAVLAGTSEATHPYELRTGQPRRGSEVREDWQELLDEAESLADEADLPQSCHAAIGKARRAVAAMATSVEGFHQRVDLALQQLQLPPSVAAAMQTKVLPALYLQAAAGRSRDGEQRQALEECVARLTLPLQQDDHPMMRLSEAAVAELLAQGKEWVSWYVRTSSSVEGRNGQLSLHHHSLHTLSAAKLAALTVLHNFWSRRGDGTTAAERFFGQKPQDLFEWLLDEMPDLPHPAQKRPRVAPSPLLN